MAKPFWKYSLMGTTHDVGMFWPQVALFQQALNEKKTLHEFFNSGTLKKELEIEHLLNELQLLAGDGTIIQHKHPATKGGDEEWMIAGKTWAINVDYTHKNRATMLIIYATEPGLVEKFIPIAKARLSRKVTKGRAYIVVAGDSGPYLHEMGTAGEDFIPDNYRPEVVEGYRHIVQDMNSDDPCGRIVLLDGPPGTGKTHMVRAMLNEVPKGTFVLIPSNMMSQLGSPNFIKAILREQKKGYPMILIVEDADEAIASRKADNVSEISALLNFSDGIFGAMLDLRIVATTNVDVADLDAAVMRPGRLCRRIEVGKLDQDQAQVVYARITAGKGTHAFKKGFYTLGEIYLAARDGKPEQTLGNKKPARAVGFTMDREETPKLQGTPADDLGMKPGELGTTDEGDLVRVREDGQFEMVGHVKSRGPAKPAGTRWNEVKKVLGIDDLEDDDDDDLIDEDPESTPPIGYGPDDDDDE